MLGKQVGRSPGCSSVILEGSRQEAGGGRREGEVVPPGAADQSYWREAGAGESLGLSERCYFKTELKDNKEPLSCTFTHKPTKVHTLACGSGGGGES